jgi:4-hydroxybenzoate polyprenyltransferase
MLSEHRRISRSQFIPFFAFPPYFLYPFFWPLLLGIQALLAFLLGQLSLTQVESPVPFYPSILCLIFVIFLLSAQIKDLKDVEGDRSCKIHTLPVMLGEDRARKVIASFVLLSYLISPLLFSPIFYSPVIFVLAILLGFANFFYIRRKDSQEKFIFATYFIYTSILLLFLFKSVFFS